MKILLWVVGALVASLLLLSLAVGLLLDASNIREKISAEVEQSTGRKLTVGEIHVGIFPTLGARIKDVKLGNVPGFGDMPMVQVGEAKIGLHLIPLLFEGRAEISRISLKDLHVDLVKLADGRSNWADLNEPQQPPQQGSQHQSPGHPPPPPQARSGNNGVLRIGGIDIANANISYIDQQQKKSYTLSAFSLQTGAIAPAKPFDCKLAFGVALADPALTAEVRVSATFDAGGPQQLFDVRNLDASIAASGAGVPGGKQDLKLSGNIHFDGGQGSFKLPDGKLALDNMVAAITLEGSGLEGDAGHFSGSLNLAPFNPREMFKALGLEAPRTADSGALQQASLSATLDAVKDHLRLNDLNIRLDQSSITGSASLAGSDSVPFQFTLKLDQIDADRYLAPAKRNPLAPQPGSKPGEGDNAPLLPDWSDRFTAGGTVEVRKLKLKNLNMANARFKLGATRGGPRTIALDADLYGGTLASSMRISPGTRPALAQTLKLESISAGPLLQDLTGKESVSGSGNVILDLTSAGRSVNELKRNLNGNASFALQNGAVKGFNLGQFIRRAQALAGGQPVQSGAAPQTDFTSMSASGKISNGVLHSDDLLAASPLLRLGGAGEVDLAGNTLDYTAKPTLVNTAGDQGGKDLAQLQGLVIPVHLSGPLNAPRVQIDLAAVLQQDSVRKLAQKLGGQNGDKLVNALHGLFGKKKQDQQNQQAPAPTP